MKSIVGIEQRLNIPVISESLYLACLASRIWYRIFSSMEFQLWFGSKILGSEIPLVKSELRESSDWTGQTKLPKEIVGAVTDGVLAARG